jgi:ferrochelatase
LAKRVSRIAVVLFNLGGPDDLSAVRPFLRNLFSDPAIIRAPAPVRLVLAEVISRARHRVAAENYASIGGASPLKQETLAQAKALEERLSALRPSDEIRVFVAMRYWRPFTEEAAAAVAAFAPDAVALLPLYPQYSTTTTASSLAAWRRAYRGSGKVRGVCCYYEDEAFIAAHVAAIKRAWAGAGSPAGVRLLFSAHGLPERIAAAGDPYRWQVERTCARVAEQLGGGWDWRVCYQSRVGPMKWIGPSTIEAIEEAAEAGLGVLIDPVAFVSEHVETLVELDRDYARIAEEVGAAPYLRAAAIGCEPVYIEALARLAVQALASEAEVAPAGPGCPSACSRCGRSAKDARP